MKRKKAKVTKPIQNDDVFSKTCGAWKRDESTEETVENARKLFRDAMLKKFIEFDQIKK